MTRLLEQFLTALAVCALAAMMLVMTADASGRYLLSAPIPGGFEITQVLMGILVFSTIPVVTLRRAHIVVDLFDWTMSRRVRGAFALVSSAICMVMALGIAWILWKRGLFLAEGNEVTANLGISQAAMAYAMAATWLLTGLAFLVVLVGGARALASGRQTGDGGP